MVVLGIGRFQLTVATRGKGWLRLREPWPIRRVLNEVVRKKRVMGEVDASVGPRSHRVPARWRQATPGHLRVR